MQLIYLVLFRKMKIEIYDTEVWNMLKENTDESLPPNNLFGQKVHSDSRVGTNTFIDKCREIIIDKCHVCCRSFSVSMTNLNQFWSKYPK